MTYVLLYEYVLIVVFSLNEGNKMYCCIIRMHVRVLVCTCRILLLLLAVCCIQQCSSVLPLMDVNLIKQQ